MQRRHPFRVEETTPSECSLEDRTYGSPHMAQATAARLNLPSSQNPTGRSMNPKMPTAFSMLNRKPTRPARAADPPIQALAPAPMRVVRPVHRRLASRSCDNVDRMLPPTPDVKSHVRTDSHDDDLETFLELYHGRNSEHSDCEDLPTQYRNSAVSSSSEPALAPRVSQLTESSDSAPLSINSEHANRTPPSSSPEVPPDTPKVQVKAVPRDRYGFRCETQHVTLDHYNAWNAAYEETLIRRRHKWDVMLNEAGLAPANGVPVHFPPRSTKLQRYVRKGVPPEYRGQAWFFYANGPKRLRENPGLYDKLVDDAGKVDDTNTELIERDLHRTFPDNSRYKPDGYVKPIHTSCNVHGHDQNEPPLIKSLRRVLQAFALYRPKVGYCQSLNFIAGLFLLFLDEEKSFWMLVIVTTDYLPNVHDTNLEGANVDQAVLMLSIKESLPAIWSKMGGNIEGTSIGAPSSVSEIVTKLPPITLVTAAWFMSAFTGILPMETTLRVWDCFFYEGSKILFRIALTILKLGEAKILAVQEFIEIFQIVQALPKDLIDPSILMEACFKRRNGFGHLSQKDIDQRRDRAAKMRQKSMKNRVSRDDLRVESNGLKPGVARSVFRR